MTNNNTLVFEGAGWDGADISKESGVGNCRIRTRIRNNDGRLIYLEMTGIRFTGKQIPSWAKGFTFAGSVDHCFYCDSEWDERRGHSSELSHIGRKINFEYSKESILNFVNEYLKCSFNSLEVVNGGSIRVHDTKEPLCDCSKEGYEPYQDIKININVLDDVKPVQDYRERGFAKYKLPYNFIKELPYLKTWMQERTDNEKKQFPNFNYYTSLRWNKEGIITSMEISARQNFVTMGLGAEQLESVIGAIKNCQ